MKIMPKFSLTNQTMIDETRLQSFIQQYGGNHISHLLFLRDKEFFLDKTETVLIAYRTIANKLIVLGDPLGDAARFQDGIEEFQDYAKASGCSVVFYQTSKQTMSVYHEFGYKFMKLGCEARVDLKQFTLAGKQGAKLRTKMNKYQRENYRFEVLEPPHSQFVLNELRQVSDDWLGTQKEKSFSVVSFQEEYVANLPVALLYHSDGSVVAFATLPTDYQGTLIIDLMRKRKQTTYGTMDVLFIHIFEWGKKQGYEQCSLGMAPLANVGTSKHAYLREKLIRHFFYKGNSFYNFKGLQEFKGKFATHWEPKYLVYKHSFVLTAISQVILLINKPPRPSFRFVKKVKYLLKRAI